MSKILVVDDDSEVTDFLVDVLENEGGCQVKAFHDRNQAAGFLNNTVYSVVITDFKQNDSSELNLLDFVVEHYPETKCIIFAKDGSIRDSVEAIKRGAFDYLTRPVSPKEIVRTVEKASAAGENYSLKRRKGNLTKELKFGELIGESTKMLEVFRSIKKVSATNSTVLITGESGTGKELIARAIHHNSNRRKGPLVTINCGAIPGELLESELFGHEKGAFTGAHRTRIGRFEMADGGTIFLDEIGDMSHDLQVKLLRVLQEQSFERVGSTKTINVNIRILAATNKDLLESIKEKTFREDLYYRLNVIPITVPPLKDRKTDIPLLINFFIKRMGGRRKYDRKRMKTFSDEALRALMEYNWPGNIRELENIIERLTILVENNVVQLEDLPERIRGKGLVKNKVDFNPIERGIDFNTAVEDYQKNLILHALNKTNWVKARAAEILKMNRTTLVEKIKKMKIKP